MGNAPQPAAPASSTSRKAYLFFEVLGVAALWLLWGKFDAVHLTYGAISVALVGWLSRHLSYSHIDDPENPLISRIRWGQTLVYPFWFLWQLIVANLHVARVIVSPHLPLDPVVLRFHLPTDCPYTLVSLGNSITLTPGTFTVRVHDGVFVIHALDLTSANSLVDGSMQRKVAAMFGEDVSETIEIGVGYAFEPSDRALDR